MSVQPIVDLYNFLSGSSGREIIRKVRALIQIYVNKFNSRLQSWEMSKVYNLNLGVECLTSKKTKALCRVYISKDKTLQEEIKSKLGAKTMESVMAPIESEADVDDDDEDHGNVDDEITSEIPLQAVIHNNFGIDVEISSTTEQFCVPAETVSVHDGHPSGKRV